MRFIFPATLLTLVALPLCGQAQCRLCGDGVVQRAPVEKRPWVGVSVSQAPAALRHQLKVSDGVGLVIEFVQPGSPGAEAGLKPFDLLLKLDDQWLINPEQFAVLIRMHHAGDEVKLTLLRQAGEQTIPVKLAEHEFSPIPDWDNNVAWPPAPPLAKPNEHRAQRVLTWLEGPRQITVTTTDGHTTLLVRDNSTGRVVFDGPIDSAEQRKNLPDDVRGVLESLSKISTAFGDSQPTPHDAPADKANP